MKNILVLIIISIFSSCSIAAVPNDVLGYGKTKWSMTEQEVYKAELPNIIKLKKPIKFKRYYSSMAIKNIRIASQNFEALYLFNSLDGEFSQVNLTGLENKNPLINKNTFNNLEKLLTQKYGEPTYKDENKLVSWAFPSTTIELSHMYIPDIMTNIIVVYKPSSTSMHETKDL